MKFTEQELINLMKGMQKIFSVVRLVDVSLAAEYSVEKDDKLEKQPYHCFDLLKRSHRCENCTSAMAFKEKRQITKFEFIGDNVFFVISTFVTVDENPFVLESIIEIKDKSVFDSLGHDYLKEHVISYNHQLYTDSLTGVFNRRYYDEQITQLNGAEAVAMIDIDNFKSINDIYGHITGDKVLQNIAQTISLNIRSSDVLIRFGGDEFLLFFNKIEKNSLATKLENLVKMINKIKIENLPDLNVSISMGAIYSKNAVKKITCADQLLYKAKKTKNTFVLEESCDE